jgi:hypothetical protein
MNIAKMPAETEIEDREEAAILESSLVDNLNE